MCIIMLKALVLILSLILIFRFLTPQLKNKDILKQLGEIKNVHQHFGVQQRKLWLGVCVYVCLSVCVCVFVSDACHPWFLLEKIERLQEKIVAKTKSQKIKYSALFFHVLPF